MNEFETAVVNEPSVCEPLKFCFLSENVQTKNRNAILFTELSPSVIYVYESCVLNNVKIVKDFFKKFGILYTASDNVQTTRSVTLLIFLRNYCPF